MDKLNAIALQCLVDLGLESNEDLKTIKSAMVRYKESAPEIDPHREESFNDFWEKYNIKKGKHKALKIWMKLKQKDIDEIFRTVETFVAVNEDPKYRPHPTTYLNGRRWEDELEAPKKIVSTKQNTWTW